MWPIARARDCEPSSHDHVALGPPLAARDMPCMGDALCGEGAKSITCTHYIWGLALIQALALACSVSVASIGSVAHVGPHRIVAPPL